MVVLSGFGSLMVLCPLRVGPMLMPPDNFAARAYIWHRRVKGTQFHHADYRDLMERAKPGDLIYCDPLRRLAVDLVWRARLSALRTFSCYCCV